MSLFTSLWRIFMVAPNRLERLKIHKISFRYMSLLLCVLLMGLSFGPFYTQTYAQTYSQKEETFSPQSQAWLESHANETIKLGLDPQAGMEFFLQGEEKKGYMIEVANLLSERLGLNFQLIDDQSWGEVYQGLHDGDIDVLFGANPTPERLQTMAFTEPVYSVPYTVLANVHGDVKTIGDLYNKRVGFIAEDIGNAIFKASYTRIDYESVIYPDQQSALSALSNGLIDGFVTSGGDIVYEYIYSYPNVTEIVQLETIRSELTLSVLKGNQPLLDAIQVVLDNDRLAIDKMIQRARQSYVRIVINLSSQELEWLEANPIVRVGVPTDYLPVDYNDQGRYGGIAGTYFMNFSELVGFQVEAIPNTFDALYTMALQGQIDVLNMAKTNERLETFIFTEPFSNERDLIYGHRSSPYIHDTYGLEGKRVAVIDGFWHQQYLERNLQNVTIIKTKDIQESLALIASDKVDYLIETPSVAEYYIVGLGYSDIIKKGETSSDSFLYFGAQKNMAPMVSIFNKAKKLISYEEAKYNGVENLPQIDNIKNKRLFGILVLLSLLLALLILVVSAIIRRLSKQSAEMMLLKERERLIYLDPLTELHNRNYFNHIESSMDQKVFPQCFIMMDINDLKLINDNYGHLIGDQMICKFANIIKQQQKVAFAIRMGGDEFILCLLGNTEIEIQAFIENLRLQLAQVELCDAAQPPKIIQKGIQVAMGYCFRENAEKTMEEALHESDAAMYKDKLLLKKLL